MEFENIKRGFVHFRLGFFNESYAYIYLLDTLGFSVVLSSDILSIETNATEAVSSVTFKVTNLFWGDNVTFIDYNISDGFSHDFVIPTGLWELTAYAYDEDENLIDKDKIDYLVFFSRGGDEGQFRRVSKLRDRLRTRLLNR